MLARSIPCCQGCPYKAYDATDGCYGTTSTMGHVGQHLLSDRYGAQVVELHKCLVHVHICVHTQRTLTPTAVIYQHVYLRMSSFGKLGHVLPSG